MASIFGRKKKNDYFKMFCDNLDFSCQSLEYLRDVLENFDSDEKILKQQMTELHAIEHAADTAKHKMMGKLAKEFVTPIEREDIIALACVTDDITDQIEDVLQQIYIYGVDTIRPDVIDFIDILEKCLDELKHIFEEFKHFRHSKTIHQAVIDLNDLEEVGDDLYIKAMRNLFQQKGELDSVTIFSWSEIYYQLEQCCDSCEDAANLVEEVIMKNT